MMNFIQESGKLTRFRPIFPVTIGLNISALLRKPKGLSRRKLDSIPTSTGERSLEKEDGGRTFAYASLWDMSGMNNKNHHLIFSAFGLKPEDYIYKRQGGLTGIFNSKSADHD